MAETTKIEWCDATFNPWIGCTKISQGCDNCFAERQFGHRFILPVWGVGLSRQRTSDANWKLPLKWDRKAQRENKRIKVFCGSLCDVFDEAVPDSWRDDLFGMICKTQFLDWLVLTKRPEKMKRYIDYHFVDLAAHYRDTDERSFGKFRFEYGEDFPKIPLPNLWLGVTVCNQEESKKVWTLLKTPATGRFVSIEPMLGPVDLHKFELLCKAWSQNKPTLGRYLDWVICGGETGPNARPVHPDWVRSLRDQCAGTETPFFFKQWGRWIPSSETVEQQRKNNKVHILRGDGKIYSNGHAGLWQGAVGMIPALKSAAGCLLDGQEWKQFPKQLTNGKES